MLAALNNTLQLLAGMTQNQNSPAAAAPAPLPVASATKTKNDLKPSPPPNFDGDRQKGRGFINACQVYFCLCPDNFLDEQTKIRWAMTFMNKAKPRNGPTASTAGSQLPQIEELTTLSIGMTSAPASEPSSSHSTRKLRPPTAWKGSITSRASEQSTTTSTTSETSFRIPVTRIRRP